MGIWTEAISKYAYDTRRGRAVPGRGWLHEGSRRVSFVDARGERFRPDFQVSANADSERAQLVVADGLRKAGHRCSDEMFLAAELARDDLVRQNVYGA